MVLNTVLGTHTQTEEGFILHTEDHMNQNHSTGSSGLRTQYQSEADSLRTNKLNIILMYLKPVYF